jgi:hypothetical protein
MKSIYSILCIGLSALLLIACGGSGTSSSNGSSSSNDDASHCVSRSFGTIYVNECNFAVNVIILDDGETSFRIGSDDATTRTITDESFGACRVPSVPILNANNNGFHCS